MPAFTAEQVILARFKEKADMAGDLRVGYVLRRQAILHVQADHPDVDLEEGIDSLVENGLLKASESREFLFLTASGVESLASATASSG